ncbi:HPr kinase/phosphatase C-terminal domain-containing protein [Mameliella sp. CS4]|uniref:HPr kinase/phosphorylase n=1 Tax=Mameliella sp. CS4 TaxID=2862329 RepID=UPI001C5FDB20|nr:HPr kinase/phosphatase C-terminal domain-containing protein [Mameliella sp. CS4]MBW4985422.1 HPr kinase/phosphatase C-terminal domain-containing protein [Mameliella sp. CS4]
MREVLHATSVAVAGRGLMIRGASGSGKSGLALELMARGAQLIADDRTIVTRQGAHLILSVPRVLAGMIEARAIGLLYAPHVTGILLVAVLDLNVAERHRLPPNRSTRLLGVDVPLLHNSASEYFPAGLVHYLKSGRRE